MPKTGMDQDKGGFGVAKAAQKAQAPAPKPYLIEQGETDRRVKKNKKQRRKPKRKKR